MNRHNKSEQGAASMIVVVFMMVILTTISIGFLRIALNEQRIATDDDLTSRAYYAAESGIEDAKRAIQENLDGTLTDAELNADTCDVPASTRYNSVLSSGAEFDAEFECMLIDFTPDTIRSKMSATNQTRHYEVIPINPSGGSTRPGLITINWHLDATAADEGDGLVGGGGISLRSTTETSIPRVGSWSHPAMLDVKIIHYPKNNFSRNNIETVRMLVSPNSAGGGNGFASDVFLPGGSPNSAVDSQVLRASCSDNDNNMVCSMEFDVSRVAQSENIEIRITNLYRSTSFEMTMENISGSSLLFDKAQAIIDVTGRAGGVYRRVEAAVELNTPDFIPNYSIRSATDICKDFSFTNVPSEFGGIPGTSCTSP